MAEAYVYDDEPMEDLENEAEVGGDPWVLTAISSSNLAFELSEQVLQSIGGKVYDEFCIDEQSLTDNGWTERHESAMKLAMQVKETKSYPWQDASNVKYPLLTTAAIQFAARAYPAIVDGFNVVKGKVLGQPTDEKRDRADRVARHMSYQLLEEMEGWESDTDKLLHMLPIVGTVFRKTYFDSSLGYNCSELVPPEKGVANYWTRNLESCPRFTHVCEYYRNEIEEKFRSELWKRVELGASDSDDDYAPECFLEQHRLLDLDEDGYPEPYIVTVHKESRQVVRIVARWDEDGVEMTPKGEILRIKPVQYFTKYSFIPSLDGSFYDIGFGTLLNALNETINTTINQLMDAGHLSNVQGGFLGTGISIKSGGNRFKPGEWKRVETQGGALKDSIVPLPVREPSAVLFQLLGMLVEAARDITATKDVLTGDTTPQNQPVGTTLALIEQGLKVYSAIYKRIHRAFKWELNKLRRLNKLYLDPQVYFTFQDNEGAVSQQDYATEDVDVIPVSDPTVVMDSQRLARAQYLQQFMQLPFMNQKRIVERALEAGNIPDIEELFVEQGPSPQAMMEAEKLKQSGDKIKLDAIKVAAQREKDAADITRTKADAAKVLVETAAIMQEHTIVQVPPLEPPDLSGMEGAPGDGGVLPVPQGPSGPPDAGMGGVGGGNASMGAPESLSVPGAGGPEMV